MLLALRTVAVIPVKSLHPRIHHGRMLCKCIYKCQGQDIRGYQGVSLAKTPADCEINNIAAGSPRRSVINMFRFVRFCFGTLSCLFCSFARVEVFSWRTWHYASKLSC